MNKRTVDEILSNVTYDDNDYTPESIAWKLLVDDNINNGVLQFYNDYNNNNDNNNDKNDKNSFIFEILITIYFEMLFGWHKLLFYMNQEDNQEDNQENQEYNPKIDLNKITEDDLIEFKKKFEKINVILNVSFVHYSYFNSLQADKYCSVLLRSKPSDEMYFELNKNYINEDKQYHFVLNSNFKAKKELRDIYALVNLGDKKVKISFDFI